MGTRSGGKHGKVRAQGDKPGMVPLPHTRLRVSTTNSNCKSTAGNFHARISRTRETTSRLGKSILAWTHMAKIPKHTFLQDQTDYIHTHKHNSAFQTEFPVVHVLQRPLRVRKRATKGHFFLSRKRALKQPPRDHSGLYGSKMVVRGRWGAICGPKFGAPGGSSGGL